MKNKTKKMISIVTTLDDKNAKVNNTYTKKAFRKMLFDEFVDEFVISMIDRNLTAGHEPTPAEINALIRVAVIISDNFIEFLFKKFGYREEIEGSEVAE